MRRTPVLACCALALTLAPAAPAQQRKLLYPAEIGGRLKAAADAVRNLDAPVVPYDKLAPAADYYARVVPRRVVVDEADRLRPDAVLGTKPFVFVTTPEGLAGKSLLGIYLDIGYGPGDVLTRQRDEDMVALVFRFPRAVTPCGGRDGTLPADWDRRVYVPTWDNVHALFARLAAAATVEPDRAGEFQPDRLFFRSEADRAFARSYPRAGVERLKKSGVASYDALMLAGGADWEYRRLLEEKFSAYAHFRGTGRTLNVVLDPYMRRADSGVLEYVGPNARLVDLPELAVVHLGALRVEDGYTNRRP